MLSLEIRPPSLLVKLLTVGVTSLAYCVPSVALFHAWFLCRSNPLVFLAAAIATVGRPNFVRVMRVPKL